MFVLDADEDAAPLDRLMDQLDLHPDDADDYDDNFSAQVNHSQSQSCGKSGGVRRFC